MSKFTRISFLLALGLMSLQQAGATTVDYEYSGSVFLEIRGNQLATADQSFFSPGATISGGFTYDNAVSGFPGVPVGTVYNAISNLFGMVEGNSYFDNSGGIILLDNSFDLNPTDPNDPLIDLMAIVADGTEALPNLAGFSVVSGGATFALVNVRLFWFSSNGDFLSDESLLSNLAPLTEVARIALDFQDINDSNSTHTVFAEPLSVNVAPVPLPAGIWLFLSALGLLRVARR